MDDDTQHQNYKQAGNDLRTDNEEEKVHEVQGSKLDEEKPNHNGQVVSNDLKNDDVDTEKVLVVKGKRKRANVSVWRLFQYANIWDILMIITGTVMAVVAGLGLPGHLILVGSALNQFVYHSLVLSNNLSIATDSLLANETCATYQMQLRNDPLRQGSSSTDTGSGYFCSNSSSGSDITNNLLDYVCDPNGTLRWQIGLISLFYLAVATGVLTAVFLATTFWNLSAYHQIKKLRKALYLSILRQEIGWFDSVETGLLSTRLVDDVEKIQSGIGDKVAIFLQSFTTFIASFVIAFVFNWKLALAVSVVLPILAMMGTLLTKIIASFTVREQEAYASAGGIAEEVLSAIRTVVAFGGEQKEAERYGEKLKLTRNEGYKKSFFSNLVVGTIYFVIFSTYALSLWYGSVLILDCELSAGDVIIVFLCVINGSFSLGNALPKLEAFAIATGSATVVFEIIDKEPLIDWSANEGETPDHLEGNIKFNKVGFAYPTRPDIQILNDLDLEIKAGQTVALVGASGCGKSTTVQLIQRFYNPGRGQITIDSREISTYNLQWLRRHIGVVSQEPVLFHASIAENIRFGREDATMDDIIQAAKNSNAHDFISKMPDGYDTQVGQRGAQLSGGQKQRIAIARALVRNPKILLLDEATSALDNQSEKVVQEALDKARQGRTTIVIAHRLSTIQSADVIVAISGGKVAQFGSHQQLMEKKGLYYELVTAQKVHKEKDRKLDQPLARFREAVNKSIEQRRQLLAKFRDAVKQSMTQHKQKKFSPSHKPRPSIRRSLSRRQSSLFDLSSLAAGAMATQVGYFTEIDDLNDTIAEENMEDNNSKEKGDENQDSQSISVSGDLKHKEATKTSFVELLKLNRPDWYLVLIGVLCSAVIGCIFPVIAIPFSEVLKLYGLSDPEAIERGVAKVSAGLVGAAVGAFLFHFTAYFSLSIAGERLTKRLRYLSFKAMLKQEMSWFDRKTNSTGALLTRLASDTASVKGATGIVLGTVLQALCSLIAGVIISLIATWELALLIIITFPALALTNYFQIRILASRAHENKRRMEESGQTAVESIDNIHTVASLGLEPHFCSKYINLLNGPFRSNIKSVLVQALMLAIGQSVIFYIYAACQFISSHLVIEERTSYDRVFRVLSTVYFTAHSIGQVTSLAPDLTKTKVSATRILALLKRKPQIDASKDDGIKLDKVNGTIAADSVHFSYPTRSKVKVLQGLTVSVKPGQMLALVGPSGCGKSTLISLVERFYDPSSGHVTLEGTDIKALHLSWLRQQIGIVPQEPVLFDTSIADNIRYGALHRQVSDEEVIEAAKSANIHNFIESLPLGYATNVGSKGTQLSGGQKQRIAIARALVRNPKILLLDEATSALDTESEKIVQEALDKARQGRTSIVIAHRLSTIYNSDVIAVIHEGQVIESGTHAQLMGLKEAYYHLNTIQQEASSQ